MNYEFAELTDMIMCYGEARGNGREARRIYEQRFPNRRHPHHSTFAQIHQRLRETGNLRPQHVGGGRRDVRTSDFEDNVIERFSNEPSASTRAVAHDMGTSRMSVWRVLHEYDLHVYHLQKVQALGPNDFAPRMQFVQWFLHQSVTDPAFPTHVLFTDEACFTRTGYFNNRDSHIWDYENPHTIFVRAHQQQFSVNIWAGIIGNHLIGPVIFPPRLNGADYLQFLQNTLPELLEDVPLAVRRNMWFQHDGAPPHFSIDVRAHLTAKFGEHWIGRAGPVAWPPRSPDLTPLDYFLWGYVKSIVYVTPVDNRAELIDRINAAFQQIRNNPVILDRVGQSMLRRCQECNEVQGRQFEQLLL